MKTKNDLKKPAGLKLLLVLPLIAVALTIISSCGKTKSGNELAPPPPPPPPVAVNEKTDGAYQVVDEMPVFPGGETELIDHISRNITYPKEAKEKGTQGKVVVKFMVKEDGTVSSVSVSSGADPLLDAEAVRVIGTLPKFTPGKLKGEAVPVWYMIPINFSLN